MTDIGGSQNTSSETSILERYLSNLSVKVAHFAVCLLDDGWRLSLPGPPCAMLHFVVEGEGWLSCRDGTHRKIGPNWVIVIPTGLAWLSALDDPRLAKVIDHIPDAPGAPHTVESLADVACMSRSVFSSHFQDAFFRSPMALVNHVRLERAAKLLQTSNASIEQIGQRVGFSSRSHFLQASKKHTGMAPASCRAR